MNQETNFTYYLAYGSNLFEEQMKKRCKNAKLIGTTILKGYRLRFYKYLTIEKSIKDEIPIFSKNYV